MLNMIYFHYYKSRLYFWISDALIVYAENELCNLNESDDCGDLNYKIHSPESRCDILSKITDIVICFGSLDLFL